MKLNDRQLSLVRTLIHFYVVKAPVRAGLKTELKQLDTDIILHQLGMEV